MQIPYLPLRGRKVPGFKWVSKGPRMEICGISGLSINIVPRWHQSNGNIKRKLRTWRVQTCITLVGADTVLSSARPQITPFQGGSIGPRMEICRISGQPILIVPCLQKEATGMEISKMYYPSRCRYRTFHCGAARYPISCGVV